MQVEIIVDGSVLRSGSKDGKTFFEAPKKGKYIIRLRNDQPSRKLVVLSVDGINVMNGEDGSYDGPGYVLGPWETVDIPGWRRSDKEVAAFEFKDVGKSYASQTGRGTTNVGVIGAAVFDEKVQRYVPPPQPIVIEKHIHHHDRWPWVFNPWRHPYDNPYTPTWTSNGFSFGTDTVTNSVNSSPPTKSVTSQSILTRSVPSSPRTKATKSVSVEPLVADVGTAYGERADFHTVGVSFIRASVSPSLVIEVRYATKERLKKMGIVIGETAHVIGGSAFPASTGAVPAPPGWK